MFFVFLQFKKIILAISDRSAQNVIFMTCKKSNFQYALRNFYAILRLNNIFTPSYAAMSEMSPILFC